jgi:peptide deformylase
MILSIVGYGSPILRQVCKPITADYEGFDTLLADMWATMYNSNGVGLAAPQINKSIRLFIIDTIQIVEGAEDDEEREELKNEKPRKQTFINAKIVSTDGTPWAYNEGCLSIPKLRADVMRAESVTLEYQDETFKTITETFSGITARVILHEYDHIEGKLFIDHLKPLKRKMIGGKLDSIAKGNVNIGYKMIFPK